MKPVEVPAASLEDTVAQHLLLCVITLRQKGLSPAVSFEGFSELCHGDFTISSTILEETLVISNQDLVEAKLSLLFNDLVSSLLLASACGSFVTCTTTHIFFVRIL